MVRRRPLPSPTEPLRRGHAAHPKPARRGGPDEGRRGLWLTALARLGLGFDR
jgi:hypothetical protein